MNAIRQFLKRIRATAVRRPTVVEIAAMGKTRRFVAWDLGADTFIFEQGVAAHLQERPSVLIAAKSSLRSRTRGQVMTLTTGNHSVAAFPLLDGRFWQLAHLPSDRRGEVLMREIVCANVADGRLELSQREVTTSQLVAADEWLRTAAGFQLGEVLLSERNDQTLAHYHALGQEWRVKPLAWTANEMKVALAAARKRIASSIVYYHSTRGVHLLTFAEFRRFAALAQSDPAAFVRGLRELVSVYEGNRTSFTRMPKHRGHHEIEFFGLVRGAALTRLVPELEKLMEAITLGRIGQLGVIQRIEEIVARFESSLSRPEFADENSTAFVEALYMYITGEIYLVVGEGSTPAFDDRRTALAGATFVEGRPVFHPGADARSQILLGNLRMLMSKDEQIEYANVYELRSEEEVPIGSGLTREIVFKTTLRPLETSLVEKRLSSARRDYGGYMMARVGALKALGLNLSANYRLLRRRPQSGRRPLDFYIRERCEGETMESIPENYFRSAEDQTVEEREVVLTLATLMGDAAAQTLAMKKFDPQTESPLYGVGKEIYEFEYDLARERVVPKRVAICSVRGSFGWPNLERSDENLEALANFYLGHFAHALKAYRQRHTLPMAELAERFMDGFEFRTHQLAWQLSVMRDEFEAFRPPIPRNFGFADKWNFVMWSLERQERRLPFLRRRFYEKVKVVEDEALRDNPQ